ncbi:hypothetical protein DT019_34270 [Streptomyces sp. SDr-06]|nr:hypothetical protein DT019_34270 [Streptomyces sp. SDr-06]
MSGLALLVTNLDGYPLLDEFARPGLDDGHGLLDARKKIKVLTAGSISPRRADCPNAARGPGLLASGVNLPYVAEGRGRTGACE